MAGSSLVPSWTFGLGREALSWRHTGPFFSTRRYGDRKILVPFPSWMTSIRWLPKTKPTSRVTDSHHHFLPAVGAAGPTSKRAWGQTQTLCLRWRGAWMWLTRRRLARGKQTPAWVLAFADHRHRHLAIQGRRLVHSPDGAAFGAFCYFPAASAASEFNLSKKTYPRPNGWDLIWVCGCRVSWRYICVCVYVCMYVCMCLWINTCVCVCACVYVYVRVCTYMFTVPFRHVNFACMQLGIRMTV